MAKEKKLSLLQKELHDLGVKRAKDLQGLGRKDRAKISQISSQFHVDREAILAKYKSDESKAAEKKAIADAKSKQDADDKADAAALKKQKAGK